MYLFFRDTVKGMRRRWKEILLLAVVEFTAMAFIMASLLFQKNSENFKFEMNKSIYGDWVVAEVNRNTETYGQQLSWHSYFDMCGTVLSGIPITGENGKEYESYLGYMDERFIELGHIRLREGRFPENDNEIAMDATLLAEMGYTLDTGQEIRLSFADSEGNTEVWAFRLVGIVKRSAGFWSIGDVMPSALVTEHVMQEMGQLPVMIYCYRLAEKYQKIDTMELYRNLSEKYDGLTRDNWLLEYNTYLYETSFWGTEQMYDVIEKMVLVLGMAAMSFLLAAYIQKRKKAYFSLRVMGMTKFKMKCAIFFESLCFSFPSGILALAAVAIIGAFLSLFLSFSNQISYFYEVPLLTVLKALLAWLVIFAGSNLIAMTATGRKHLYGSAREVSVKHLFRWRRNRLSHKHIYSSIFIRESRTFWVRSLFGGLVCLIFTGILMICGARLWESYWRFEHNCQYADFIGTKISKEPIEAGEYVWSVQKAGVVQSEPYENGTKQLYTGYSDVFFEMLETVKGIDSFSLSTVDDAHLFEWEDMEHDAYIKAVLAIEKGRGTSFQSGEAVEYSNTWGDVLKGNTLAFGYESWFVTNTEEIYEKYTEKYGNRDSTMNYQAFADGEQVFLIIPDVGSGLTAGSKLNILAGEKKIEVEIGCVIGASEIGMNDYARFIVPDRGFFYAPEFCLVASEKLGRRIAEAEGKEYMYNRIEMNMDLFADYNTTVKQYTRLLQMENSSVDTNYESKQALRKEWISNVMMYGFFILLLFAFFIIIRNNIIQAGFTFQGNQIRRLRMLGMGKVQIKQMYLLQGFYESRWIWLAVPFIYFLRGRELYEQYNRSVEDGNTLFFYSEEASAYLSDAGDIVRYTINRYVNIWICMMVLVLILIINAATRYFVVDSNLKTMEEERQGNL